MDKRKNMTLVYLWNRYSNRCKTEGLKYYQYRQLCELYSVWCEENYETIEVLKKRGELSKSTVVCSQREPKSWASMILNDEVSSNAIMKRATKHYTVVIESKG